MTDTPPEGSKLAKIMDNLAQYVYGASVGAKNYGVFIGGEPVNEAVEEVKSLLLELVNEQYELSLTDIEKYEYQNKEEMVVISKTQLVKALEAL